MSPAETSISESGWGSYDQDIEEKDDEGDVIPDGVFSESEVDEFASDREDSVADDHDSDIDDPSTFCEFESEVDETEDTGIQQVVEAGFEPCSRRRVRFADDDGGSTDRRWALGEPTTQVDSRATYLEATPGLHDYGSSESTTVFSKRCSQFLMYAAYQ